jgi:hypothetical protein
VHKHGETPTFLKSMRLTEVQRRKLIDRLENDFKRSGWLSWTKRRVHDIRGITRPIGGILEDPRDSKSAQRSKKNMIILQKVLRTKKKTRPLILRPKMTRRNLIPTPRRSQITTLRSNSQSYHFCTLATSIAATDLVQM